jgi:hypothetical protein
MLEHHLAPRFPKVLDRSLGSIELCILSSTKSLFFIPSMNCEAITAYPNSVISIMPSSSLQIEVYLLCFSSSLIRSNGPTLLPVNLIHKLLQFGDTATAFTLENHWK